MENGERRKQMIELRRNDLVFSFPEVHPRASLRITFQRTFRIPDDGKDYPLPPGFGSFPLRHVDDFPKSVPEEWIEHGGVMLPMYQSEALWVSFDAGYVDGHGCSYPFAVKVATGKINAVTGDSWSERLKRSPQDYMVTTRQPWLDGYCVEKGVIRQFVAMPLGSGYSAEEQITGEAEHGGMQMAVYPMRREAFERHFPKRKRRKAGRFFESTSALYCRVSGPAMSFAPGGRMRQEIYDDPFDLNDWETAHKGRCFVHAVNSLVWRSIAGEDPPTVPFTAKEYNEAGLPWFNYYTEDAAVEGSAKLAGMKSVAKEGEEKGDKPLPENESVTPEKIVQLRSGLKRNQVREGAF